MAHYLLLICTKNVLSYTIKYKEVPHIIENEINTTATDNSALWEKRHSIV